MIKNKEKDLSFTEDGDFLIKRNSLRFSSDSKNELLLDILIRRLQSSSTDWNSRKAISADLDIFRGEILNTEIISIIAETIYAALIADELLDGNQIDIKINQIDKERVVYSVVVYSKNDENNIVLGIMYDQRVNKIIPRYINPRELSAWQD